MNWEEDIKGMASNIDTSALNEMEPGESIQAFQYSRPIDSYPTMPDAIVNHLFTNGPPSKRIYTEHINKGGRAVQDKMENYLATHDHLSSGTIASILDTPLHFHYKYMNGWKEELEKYEKEKAHFVLGTFLHQCILEPTKFGRVVSEPKFRDDGSTYRKNVIQDLNDLSLWWCGEIQERSDKNMLPYINDLKDKHDTTTLNGAKKLYQDLTELSGLYSIPEDMYARIKILESYCKHYGGGVIPQLLLHSKREISLYAVDDETGLKLRVRPDALAFEENIGVNAIISIKSTRAQRLNKYFYDACNLDYLMKDAMYMDVASRVTGRDFCTTINIVMQTVEPYAVMVLYYKPEDIELGKYRYRQAINQVKEAMDKDYFPGYDAFAEAGNYGMIEFQTPAWYGKELSPISLEN